MHIEPRLEQNNFKKCAAKVVHLRLSTYSGGNLGEDFNHVPGGLALGDPKAVPLMTVCSYQFLDDLSFIRRPEDVFNAPKSALDKYVEAVKERFKTAGWEGDGNVGILWLPPFVGVGAEDTWGAYVWHVKQSNNGLSWLAGSSDLIQLERLRFQNKEWPGDTHKLAGIMFTSSLLLVRSSQRIISEVRGHLKELSLLPSPAVPAISQKLLVIAQGDLIGALNEYLNECYLQVLLEVFERGNTSSLPLGKFKANLNPMRYIPGAEDGVEADEGAGQWFTVKGLVTDIWHSYMFEPFDTRRSLLFKACEYTANPSIQRDLAKHVQLRNCVQHHEGAVTEDALKLVGVTKFVIARDEGGTLELTPGSKIAFSIKELAVFARALVRLAGSFDAHTRKRIRQLEWVPRSFVEGKK
jgi:hypothetical protein